MKLKCKIGPTFFDMLGDQKEVDFRQIEDITFENSVTGDIKVFRVADIQMLPEQKEASIKERYPNVPWDDTRPIFAIILSTEIKSFVPPELPAPNPELDKVRANMAENTKFESWEVKS